MSSVCVSSITPDPSSLPSSSTFVTLNLVGWLSGMLSLHRQLQQLPMTAAGEVIPLGNWLVGFSEGEKIPLPLSLYVLRDFMVTRCQHCPEHEGNSPIFHLARKLPCSSTSPCLSSGPSTPPCCIHIPQSPLVEEGLAWGRLELSAAVTQHIAAAPHPGTAWLYSSPTFSTDRRSAADSSGWALGAFSRGLPSHQF